MNTHTRSHAPGRQRWRRLGRGLCAAALLAPAACLEPLVDDDERIGLAILPRDAAVPPISEAPLRLAQLAANDGLDEAELMQNGGVVARRFGYADGQFIRYWDFGPVRPVGAIVYALLEEDLSFVEGHPFIFDSIPGDPGYSPFWVVHVVVVRRSRDDGGPVYADEKLTSVRALEDAVELGMVTPPEPLLVDAGGTPITEPAQKPSGTKVWHLCPVVPPGTRLELSGSQTGATVQMFAHGFLVDAFVLGGGPHPMAQSGAGEAVVLPESAAYAVRSRSALAVERVVFASGPAARTYTPLVRLSEVRLTGDSLANIDAVADLVSGNPPRLSNDVSELVDTGMMMNWPVQRMEGMP